MEEMKSPASTEPVPPAMQETGMGRPKFPTVGDLLAMLGIFLLAQFIGAFIGIGILGVSPLDQEMQDPNVMGKFIFVSSLASGILTLIGIIAYRHSRGGRGTLVRWSSKGFDPMLILWGFLLMLAVGIVLEPLLNLLPPLPIKLLGTGVWTMAALVVVAPVFEEFICRGVLLESVRSRYGVLMAWIIPAFFFGIMHFQPQQSVNAFFLGLILGFLYLRTNSIWIVIILHAMNNAVAYVMMMVMGGDQDTLLVDQIGNGTLYAVIYTLSAILCIVSFVMVWRTIRQLDDRSEKQGVV